MFTTNLDRLPGAHFFEGAVGLDYAPLYEQWAALDKAARAKARREVTELVHAHYEALCAAFVAHDRARFEAILAGE